MNLNCIVLATLVVAMDNQSSHSELPFRLTMRGLNNAEHVVFDCPSCGEELHAPLKKAGRDDSCAVCAAVFNVPGKSLIEERAEAIWMHRRKSAVAAAARDQERRSRSDEERPSAEPVRESPITEAPPAVEAPLTALRSDPCSHARQKAVRACEITASWCFAFSILAMVAMGIFALFWLIAIAGGGAMGGEVGAVGSAFIFGGMSLMAIISWGVIALLFYAVHAMFRALSVLLRGVRVVS